MQPVDFALLASFARSARRWLRKRATGLAHAVLAEVRARATRCQLERLSDRMLRDIGLRRDQIDDARRNPRRL